MELQHRQHLNSEIAGAIRQALRVSLYNPSLACFFLKNLLKQRKTAIKRECWEKEGIHVPPFLIASITRRCNLKCAGCYARARQETGREEGPPWTAGRRRGRRGRRGRGRLILFYRPENWNQ